MDVKVDWLLEQRLTFERPQSENAIIVFADLGYRLKIRSLSSAAGRSLQQNSA
jgi:hypothetical protein